MLRKAYTPFSMFVEAFALLVVGILFFVNPEGTLNFAVAFAHLIVWIAALVYLFRWVTKRGEERPSLLQAVLLLALAVFLTANPNFLSGSVSLVFALWIMINAVVKFVFAFQLWKTKSKGYLRTLIQGILYALFAIAVFKDLTGGAVSLSWILGIYCLVSAVFGLIDAFRELLGTDINGKRVKQRIRIKPPVLLTALMPMSILRAMDDPDEEAEVAQWTRKETSLEDPKPNLEIFLHLGKNAAFGFGHMDIAVDDKSFSYGNYDNTKNILGGLFSEGVLMKARKAEYIRFSLEHEEKRLIGYGVVLSDEQKAAVLKKLEEFLQESSRWYPDQEKNPVQYQLTQDAGGEYYKIGKGPYKTYNALSTNCVAVANMLSGSGGVDLMNPQGIITPGTYAEFLDRQFLRKNSIVVSRTVYR